MYIVTIKNESYVGGSYVLVPTEIQNEHHKLVSGSIVEGINAIDSFSFSVLPNNPGFNNLHDFKTIVEVYNTATRRYEFHGRVLCTSPSMGDDGMIAIDATCESFLGYLCDSVQELTTEVTISVGPFLYLLINAHNSQVEDGKKFTLGTIEGGDDAIRYEPQRGNTWDILKKNLIETHGGEIRIRVEGENIILDYVRQIGEEKATTIEVSKNMKSIVKEKDPSAFITRLIPLGARLGDNTEKRLDISSANGGVKYIDDELAMEEYGIHVGYVEFDDINNAAALLSSGREWLEANNKVAIKYSITALDLSIIGLDIDDFAVGNYYPVKNKLLNIDDVARVTKKTIDVCDESKTSLEIGESFKTLSEIQREQMNTLGKVNADIAVIIRDYTTNKKLSSEITKTVTMIQQSEEDIILSVSGGTVSVDDYNTFKEAATAAFALKVGIDEKDRIVSMINASANIIDIKSNRLSIDSDHFKLTTDGRVTATALKLNSDKFSLTEDGVVIASAINIQGGTIKIDSSSGTNSVEIGRDGITEGIRLISNYYVNHGVDAVLRQSGNGLIFATRPSGGGPMTTCNDIMLAGVSSGSPCIIMSGTFYLSNGSAVTSDAKLKHDIELLDSRYDTFFDGLIARRYKYNHGKSGRYHSGYITGEVQAALEGAGITEKEFAAICTYKNDAGEEFSALRYVEFIALNTWQIQKLKARVKELEERIAKL